MPIYEKTGTLTTKMQRALVHQALAQLPAELPDPLPRRRPRSGSGLIDRRTRADATCTFRRRARASTQLNAFRSPAQRRLIFEEFFLFQLGLVLRQRATRTPSARRGRS